MMSEVASVGGEGGFEMVEGSPPPAPDPSPAVSAALPPPSALPSFIGASSSSSSSAPIDPGRSAPIPPSSFARPPPPPSIGGSANPFLLRGAPLSGMMEAPPVPPTVVVASLPPPVQQQPVQIGVDLSGAAGQLEELGESMQPLDPTGANTGMLGWFQKTVSGSGFLSKVAEKAKTGMDTMITTLDPQMKDYLAASGSIEIAIASDAEAKIAGVKDGFQRVYQHVNGRGLGAPGASVGDFAAQPVGFDMGRRAALDRVARLRNSGLVSPQIPIVAVENFVLETEPGQWFDLGCVLIDDPVSGVVESVMTQAIPLPDAVVALLRSHTPVDYPRRSSGFAVTTGAAAAEAISVFPDDYHLQLAGVARKELIAMAARSLAFIYKQRCNPQI